MWKGIISGSLRAQKALCYVPFEPASDPPKDHPGTTVSSAYTIQSFNMATESLMLAEEFCGDLKSWPYMHANPLLTFLTPTIPFAGLPKYCHLYCFTSSPKRSEGSWEDMYLTQPPAVEICVEFNGSRRSADSKWSHPFSDYCDFTISNPYGVTIGDLVEAIELKWIGERDRNKGWSYAFDFSA